MSHWEVIRQGIDRYHRIYTESSLDTRDTGYMRSFTLLPEGSHRRDYITDRRWGKMQMVFQKYCQVDIRQMESLKPLFILAQVQSNLLTQGHMTSLDQAIWDYAASEGKETGGVESAHEQIQILLSLDLGAQYKQLVRMSKAISQTRRKLHRLLQLFEDEDIHKLYKMSKGSLGGDRSKLIKDRNEVMANRLIEMHIGEPSFFSFGAGHLAGGNGVLRLLKKLGAEIRPLNRPATLSQDHQ